MSTSTARSFDRDFDQLHMSGEERSPSHLYTQQSSNYSQGSQQNGRQAPTHPFKNGQYRTFCAEKYID